MSESTPESASPEYDPLAALRQPNFLLFSTSRTFYGIGATMLQGIMLWHVHQLSDSPLALAATGLARLIPALIFTLPGGAVADTYNRHRLVMAAQSVPVVCALIVGMATLQGSDSLALIYGLIVAMGFAASFEGPARAAILPSIVKPETFTNAVTVTSTMQSFSFVVGPALGGIMIALIGIGSSYIVVVTLGVISVLSMALVKYHKSDTLSRGVTIKAIAEGIQFVRSNQVLLGAMALDMFAVIFGGVKALMPIYADDILDVGATGFGILNASFEVGSFLTAFVMLFRPPTVRTGRTLIWSIVAFGAVTIFFGISRNFYLSVFLYSLIGASDMVSVVMRSTTIQLATPDELRGRVSAVNQVFIQSSNQVNTLYSGVVASFTSATFAVVSGGFGTLATVGLVGWRLPKLYAYRIPEGGVVKSEATRAAEAETAASEQETNTSNGAAQGTAKPEETPSTAP